MYNDDAKWIYTQPIHITEIPSLTQSLNVIIQTFQQEILSQNNTHNNMMIRSMKSSLKSRILLIPLDRKKKDKLTIFYKIKRNHRRT